MTLLTSTLRKIQKPPMSLKQFMLRSEVLKLYRGFMKLGRLIGQQEPPVPHTAHESTKRNLPPLQLEWMHWVRSEFRLRQDTPDEEAVKMMLAHGKRQLQELERTILLATNRNFASSSSSTASSCSSKLSKSAESPVKETTK